MDQNNNPEEEGTAEKRTQIDLLGNMYKDYFLDYASYVILERAVPAYEDGFKPVQRRILHAMFTMDDGRFHKVANIIGQTMQYHPHGDAAIGDALVNLGQKNILIDCQGNWGDNRTGDRAAAPRYIEARLSKFAKKVVFNPKTTHFQYSYDGRKKEPVTLPVKFPLLLAQGVEGIAVGLATKILPHNFIELIKGSIDILKGKTTQILPDFQTGGMADFSNYNGGKRGGKVRVRAKIEIVDRKTLAIKEIPYGCTTNSLIDSILKANAKSKIKVKKVVDNTAKDVEIEIQLPSNTSPEMTMDALYAFTDCEVSISPNACIIKDEKPIFITVDELLKMNTFQTKNLLEWELKIREQELEDKWHFASLEKIFIENRIYQKIEDCETWEAVISTIDEALKPFVNNFKRDITEDDIIRLTEIKIKRISKFNKFQADDLIRKIEEELKEVRFHLENIVDYSIQYYKDLLKEFGEGRERQTDITSFDTIKATEVVINNAKLYVNRKEGFMGYGLKKDEFVEECSDIDDVIVFHQDGSFSVTKIQEKVFIGKNPLHIAIWKKGDDRMIYNLVYADLEKGVNYVKRFAVKTCTRDRQYPVANNVNKAKVLHFTANPNGEAELIQIQLTQSCKAKKKEFDYDFAEIDVKGRGARGNILTKYPIRKITVKRKGESTLGALQIWFEPETGRLNTNEYGELLGAFEEEDKILALYKDGNYEMTDFDLLNRFEPKDLDHIEQFDEESVITAVYYDGERKSTYVKRFQIETTTLNSKFEFLPNSHRSTTLYFVSTHPEPKISFKVKDGKKTIENVLSLNAVAEVTGWKSIGSKLSDLKLKDVKDVSPELAPKEKKKQAEPTEEEKKEDQDQPRLF